MKAKYLFMAIVAIATMSVGCQKIKDVPSVEINGESIKAEAEGGVMVIEVCSTGVDDVEIDFNKRLEYDENGDLYPTEPWITLNRVINNYDENATRELAVWTSGIEITVEPNDTGHERTATIKVRSFSVTDNIEIRQPAM